MRKRTFMFDGSDGAGDMMAKILNYYAEAAYPLGGSECAAASREALNQLAGRFLQADDIEIKRRQRPLLKSAVNWFYHDAGLDVLDKAMYERLMSQLKK